MKKLTDAINALTNFLKTASSNWKTIFVWLTIVWAGISVYKMFIESKKIDSQPTAAYALCEEQRQELIRSITDWMGELSKDESKSVSYKGEFEKASFQFANFLDTIPQKTQKVISQMDSLLRRLRQDSIKKAVKKSFS